MKAKTQVFNDQNQLKNSRENGVEKVKVGVYVVRVRMQLFLY